MIYIHHLTPQLRKQLKKPLGTLLRGSTKDIMVMVGTLIEREKPAKVITVGDRVTKDLYRHHLLPDVCIVDNRIMRKEIPPIPAFADEVMEIKNPPGTITDEAWSAIERAMENAQQTKIVVDGEEDLLTLAAILTAPETSLVLYGQPHEGVVAVKVTIEMKRKVRKIVDAMKMPRKT
ncbi:MAG: DUF359 domain-containing protein [Candidatus Bathyarchaeota archaeon]|nr:MAG: DUF359 domain-containing protein [Candidatus Bathyarchaeota archaeon]